MQKKKKTRRGRSGTLSSRISKLPPLPVGPRTPRTSSALTGFHLPQDIFEFPSFQHMLVFLDESRLRSNLRDTHLGSLPIVMLYMLYEKMKTGNSSVLNKNDGWGLPASSRRQRKMRELLVLSQKEPPTTLSTLYFSFRQVM